MCITAHLAPNINGSGLSWFMVELKLFSAFSDARNFFRFRKYTKFVTPLYLQLRRICFHVSNLYTRPPCRSPPLTYLAHSPQLCILPPPPPPAGHAYPRCRLWSWHHLRRPRNLRPPGHRHSPGLRTRNHRTSSLPRNRTGLGKHGLCPGKRACPPISRPNIWCGLCTSGITTCRRPGTSSTGNETCYKARWNCCCPRRRLCCIHLVPRQFALKQVAKRVLCRRNCQRRWPGGRQEITLLGATSRVWYGAHREDCELLGLFTTWRGRVVEFVVGWETCQVKFCDDRSWTGSCDDGRTSKVGGGMEGVGEQWGCVVFGAERRDFVSYLSVWPLVRPQLFEIEIGAVS